MKILKHLFILLSFFMMGTTIAQINAQFGDDKYKPVRGQSGKDVVWIATANELVDNMLKIANVGPTDLVFDLGAGDGIIAIAAARDFGARAIGIEYNPQMAALAQRNAERAMVTDKVKIIQGDIFKEDFSEATVVTLYLMPELNVQLRPTLLKMKPGTRVVSNTFTMDDWEPDAEIDTPSKAYYWVVPAPVAGEWTLDQFDPKNKTSLSLSQRYQQIGGNLTIGDKTQPILNAKLKGDKLQFSYVDQNNNLRIARAIVTGATLKGENNEIYAQNIFTGTLR